MSIESRTLSRCYEVCLSYSTVYSLLYTKICTKAGHNTTSASPSLGRAILLPSHLLVIELHNLWKHPAVYKVQRVCKPRGRPNLSFHSAGMHPVSARVVPLCRDSSLSQHYRLTYCLYSYRQGREMHTQVKLEVEWYNLLYNHLWPMPTKTIGYCHENHW